jgi:gamma-glutamylcyclotransferase (GGCT)/AIG2-like uncharacterized protein YtfP
MMKSQLVFAYGSNMDPAQMRERCPESDLSWFIAEARDWKLCFPRKSERRKGGVASIARGEGSSVWGVVFGVSDRDLLRLDKYEGVGSAYLRESINLFDSNGHAVLAWTYFANKQDDGEFVPHRDYIDIFIRGAEYVALPEDYIGSLRGIREKAKRS